MSLSATAVSRAVAGAIGTGAMLFASAAIALGGVPGAV